MSDVADVLERAAALIEPEGAWIGGPPNNQPFAKDSAGEGVGPKDRLAACWCLYGAINAVAPNAGAGMDAKDALRDVLGVYFLADWNHAERRTQAEVVAKLREAAKIARGEQP